MAASDMAVRGIRHVSDIDEIAVLVTFPATVKGWPFKALLRKQESATPRACADHRDAESQHRKWHLVELRVIWQIISQAILVECIYGRAI